ncbi:MAG: hypothetical protein LUH46_03280 [Alistipes sp.]|nr:hypothetical protein [Alistipes sp.]
MHITINGQRADASVKRNIAPQLWNATKGRAYEKNRKGKRAEPLTGAISANILRIQRDMELDRLDVTAQPVLIRYLDKDRPERYTLLITQ